MGIGEMGMPPASGFVDPLLVSNSWSEVLEENLYGSMSCYKFKLVKAKLGINLEIL